MGEQLEKIWNIKGDKFIKIRCENLLNMGFYKLEDIVNILSEEGEEELTPFEQIREIVDIIKDNPSIFLNNKIHL